MKAATDVTLVYANGCPIAVVRQGFRAEFTELEKVSNRFDISKEII